MGESTGELLFLAYWRMLSGEVWAWEKEYKFDPSRKWRFDFAYPEIKLAVEIEGGVYTTGRHNRPIGFQNDCEKYNRAVELGWVILRYTPQMLEKDPQGVITQIKKVIGSLSCPPA